MLLAHALPDELSSTVFTSTERKARETAEVLALRRGSQVVASAGFSEVDRPAVWDDDEGATASHYLATGAASGWEPREAVVQRFDAAVNLAQSTAGPGCLLIVSHGLALSLWLDSVLDIDLVPFWQALTLPDAWLVDTGRHVLERLCAP